VTGQPDNSLVTAVEGPTSGTPLHPVEVAGISDQMAPALIEIVDRPRSEFELRLRPVK